MLYLHGGAYCFEITPFHWKLIAEMAERLRARVSVPIYPLAPEHDIHAIFASGMAAYRRVAEATRPENLVLMGDSAGGNMAVVLTMMAALEKLPRPSRMALISPGLDLRLENPDVFDVERLDPWLGIPGGLEAVRLYSAGLERSDWRISPVTGDLSVLHDQNGFLLANRSGIDLCLVVVNNDGGGIFSLLPHAEHDGFERLFGTPHGLDLGRLASLYNVDHELVERAGDVPVAVADSIAAGGLRMVEVRTERAVNAALHRRLLEAVAQALG
jgi:hypothetical protein